VPISSTRVITYAYDGLLRLVAAVETPGNRYAYSYDDAGNRTGVWVNGTRILTQTFDAADQVVGGSYDAVGNLLSDGTTSYTYDALNRLTQQGSTPNSYNGDGVLVRTGATTYTQDLAAPLTQILQARQGGTTTHYLYGLERLASTSGGTRTWYAADALGSVCQTLNNSGSVLSNINYDPWGQVESGTTLCRGVLARAIRSGALPSNPIANTPTNTDIAIRY
jgi:YD repeat-containing protein